MSKVSVTPATTTLLEPIFLTLFKNQGYRKEFHDEYNVRSVNAGTTDIFNYLIFSKFLHRDLLAALTLNITHYDDLKFYISTKNVMCS